jgi:broad specificity phosphatase PhoE
VGLKLIIVRHGETEANVKRINQGHSNGKLTKLGIKQARKAGKRLAKENIDIIYCSDLGRTRDTAREIMKYVKAPICFVKDIRERNLGVFDGKPFGTFTNYAQEKGLDLFSYRPSKGESRKDVRDRIMLFYKKCLKKHKNDTVLWVTHGGIITRMNVYFLKAGDSAYPQLHPTNCAVTIIEADDENNHEVKLVNCTKHLKSKPYKRRVFKKSRKAPKKKIFLPIL